MSDIRNNNDAEKNTADSLGLDNESILRRHKAGDTPPKTTDRERAQSASVSPQRQYVRPAAAQNRRQADQPTRQMPRQAAPQRNASAQRPAAAQRPAPAQAQRPVSRTPQNVGAAAPKPQAAVVPTAQKKSVEAVSSKQAAPAPAYAARRQTVPPAAQPSGGEEGASAAVPQSVPNKKSGSAKAGADMMVSIVKGIIYMVLVLVVSVFISIFVIRVGNDVFAFVKSDEQIDITIPENATTAEIADILYDNGIISYPSVFKLYASLKHEKGDYLGGDYTVSPSLSYDKLRSSFKKQIETGTCWITIPEGYTTDEIIDLMVENGIGEREKYIDVINNYDFDYWFVKELTDNGISEDRAYRLDGYLFPDSYQFYKASSEETVINRLLSRFNEVFVGDYRTRAGELGYTVDQILTIASMVEKEAGRSSDFMNVSSVFHNRLNDRYNYARLQSDATTVYAIQVATGQRPKDITPEDNNYDSPYNTYLYEGLPPGPITNPSASAIRYAMYPANTNYKYFVSAKNGTTLFAATKGEHEANIETVRQMNAD